MKKYVVIGLTVVIFFLIVFGLYFIFIKLFSPAPKIQLKPQTSSLLRVIAISPVYNATVSPDQILAYTFNQTITSEDIVISLAPKTPFVSTFSEKKLVIKPSEKLLPGVYYRVVITQKKENRVFGPYRFSVKGEREVIQTNTKDAQLFDDTQKFDREQYPDIFLVNNTPYKGTLFEIVKHDFTTTPKPHNYFIVTIKGQINAAKASVVSWLKSLGLTQTQINSLDLRYEAE